MPSVFFRYLIVFILSGVGIAGVIAVNNNFIQNSNNSRAQNNQNSNSFVGSNSV